MASTYVPIATTTLGSAQSSVTFNSFSGYTDLILIIAGTTSSSSNVYLRFNSDSGSNYSDTLLYGTGSATGSERVTNQTRVDLGNMYAGSQNTIVANIMNYSNSSVYKTTLSRANNAANIVEAAVGLWRSTSAITQIDVSLVSTYTFSSGTTFTLYGIKAA